MTTPLAAILAEALDDEYKARATYRAVIDAFGPVRPFTNIVESEGRHAEALLALHDRFGLTPPADTWRDRVTVPESLAAACRDAVEGEIENAAMYDRLLAATDDPDVRAVLERLRLASQKRHLPAFQRCLARETAGEDATSCGGAGGGRRRRGGRRRQRRRDGSET